MFLCGSKVTFIIRYQIFCKIIQKITAFKNKKLFRKKKSKLKLSQKRF